MVEIQTGIIKSLYDAQSLGMGVPRFIIIEGRSYLANLRIIEAIRDILAAQLVALPDNKIDTVREVLPMVHNVQSATMIYWFNNTDSMSANAKNAMLKITEEMPNHGYVIMTCENRNNLLGTLISRSSLIQQEPFTADQIKLLIVEKDPGISMEDVDFMCVLCATSEDIDILFRYNMVEFYKYATNILDNIGSVNGGNIFKISTKVSLKEDTPGWDVTFFLRAISVISMLRIMKMKYCEDVVKYRDTIDLTNGTIGKLLITGINKFAVFSLWLIDMRFIWKEQ